MPPNWPSKCAQNALNAALKRLKSALIHAFTLLLCRSFVVLLGLTGLRSGLQLLGRCFCSPAAGDFLSFSGHIDLSILHMRTFFLWSELPTC
jgi:hypothetical protein